MPMYKMYNGKTIIKYTLMKPKTLIPDSISIDMKFLQH